MKRLFGFVLCLSSLYGLAQSPTHLIDSLAKVSQPNQKATLAMEVATILSETDWERTLHYIDLAQESAKQSRDPKVLADFFKKRGDIYYGKDVIDIALENYLKAYEYYETLPSSERLIYENDIAITYARAAKYEKALFFFNKIYTYPELRKDTLNFASVTNNMGRIWSGQNPDSALHYFKKSERLINHIDNKDLKTYLYTNLAVVYKEKSKTDSAMHYFNLAHQSMSDENLEIQGWVFTELAELYFQRKQEDSAFYFLQKSNQLLDSVAPYGFQNQRTIRLLYDNYKEVGNYERAVHFFDRYLALSDSINLEDKRVNVERLLIEEEYRNIDKIRSLEASKRKSRNYIILLIFTVVLLALGLLLLRFRNKIKDITHQRQLATLKKEELQSKLQLKNQELIAKAMIELHRVEVIEDILKDLKTVRLKAVKNETQQAIDFVAKKLKRETSRNLWEEFEIRFEEVHESFYKKLLEKHPDLSLRERRLAALLKLNLSSKEIAQITGQSVKAIENARTRLRKKLDITNSNTELFTYLSTLETT